MTALCEGSCCRPSAVLSSDSTTTMRTNEVVIITIYGASDSSGQKPDELDHAVGQAAAAGPPRLMLISCANAGSVSDPAAIRMSKE